MSSVNGVASKEMTNPRRHFRKQSKRRACGKNSGDLVNASTRRVIVLKGWRSNASPAKPEFKRAPRLVKWRSPSLNSSYIWCSIIMAVVVAAVVAKSTTTTTVPAAATTTLISANIVSGRQTTFQPFSIRD